MNRCLIIVMLLLCGYRSMIAQSDTVTIGFLKLSWKQKPATATPNPNSFTIHGYFYKDPLPMLVTDPQWVRMNMPMPDSGYIVLSGAWADSLVHQLPRFQGRLLMLTGYRDTGKPGRFIPVQAPLMLPTPARRSVRSQ